MAGTLTVTLTVTHTGGSGGSATLQMSNITFPTTGDRHNKGNHTTHATPSTDNAVPFGTVPTADVGVGVVRNKSATDNIELSYGTGGSFAGAKFAELEPGQVAFVPLSGQIYVKCGVASSPYEALIVEI